MKNTALKSIFLALCLFLLPLILEAQTLPDWVENPPRYIGDIVYIVMKGTGKTLPEAQGRASWDTETSSFSPNLGLFTFERNVGGNRFLLSLFWSNDWFNNNALLIEDFYTQNGEEIEYYVLYSLPRAVYNVLDDVVYQYIPAFKAGTFENAIYLAANQLAQEVPRNIKVAVIGFASADKELGEFVLEETTGYLSSAGTMSLFDRKSLDSIRTEQGFQMTGDVDDESAVSIGQFAGVDVVITGSITGSGSTRRLRFKALDVKTGAVVSQTSHRY
ncbi:MAG: CsgG/HfaB family protein [Treponema sp.]|nr:CsgG/HfaB family protein [Treponema sp.]